MPWDTSIGQFGVTYPEHLFPGIGPLPPNDLLFNSTLIMFFNQGFPYPFFEDLRFD